MNQKYLAVRSEFLFGLACIPDIPEFDQKTLLCVLSSLSICIGNPKDGIDRRFNKQLLANSRIGEFIDSLVNSARIYLGEDNLKAENLEEGYPPRMKRGDNYEALSILESIFNITNEELKEKKILLLLFLSFFSQKYYYMKEIFNFVDNNMNEKQRERILLFVILFGILYKETLYVLSAIERLHYKDPKLLNPLTSLFPKTMGSNLSYNLGILCILFDKKEALIEFAQYVDMPLRDDFLLR